MANSKLIFKGKLVSGFKEGSYYMSQENYKKEFKKNLGYEPWPGTLNIEIENSIDLKNLKSIEIQGFKENEKTFGSLECYQCWIIGKEELFTHLIAPKINKHPKNVIEIISPVNLKKTLNLKDGDTIQIKLVK